VCGRGTDVGGVGGMSGALGRRRIRHFSDEALRRNSGRQTFHTPVNDAIVDIRFRPRCNNALGEVKIIRFIDRVVTNTVEPLKADNLLKWI